MVALLAAGVAAARDHLESLANARTAYVQWQADTRRSLSTPARSVGPRLPIEVSLVAGAAVGTFLLSGLLHSFLDALLLGSALLLVGVFRRAVNHANSWIARVSRVPMVARVVGGAVIGGVLARGIIAVLRHQTPAFLPMACALGGTLCVTALLLASPPPGTAPGGKAVPTRGTPTTPRESSLRTRPAGGAKNA